MTTFFVDWELWQEMTFVLACCIVVVFGLGLVKLWRTNRQVRKLEILDEEKRARTLEMRHCGIQTRRQNEIPFGVRALQSGVEVEGIWISKLNKSEFNRVASLTTLVAEQTGLGKYSIKTPNRSTNGSGCSKRVSGSSTIDQTMSTDATLVASSHSIKVEPKHSSFSPQKRVPFEMPTQNRDRQPRAETDGSSGPGKGAGALE
ncbi:hypothetical protein S40288_08805 [Stachybotrys chartarum IBT 40288]|nr:hypothetical protein S40288_08805 [Stachybotrys chartarum IBT 40288]